MLPATRPGGGDPRRRRTEKSLLDKLKTLPFFAGMSDHDLRQIADITTERTYRAGRFIVRERDRAERFFIIYRGKIEITKSFENEEEVVLGVHSDGEFFGEMALLDGAPRAANARALETTRVFEITRENFEVLLFKAPQLAFSIMKELSARLRETGALLVSHFQSRSRELAQAYLETLDILTKAAEAGQVAGGESGPRIRDLAVALGRELDLSGPELYALEIHALLTDLGVVNAPRKTPAAPGARGQGEEIPLPARILTVAAAFSSLAGGTPGRGPRARAEALAEIRRGADDRFDPRVVAALERALGDPRS